MLLLMLSSTGISGCKSKKKRAEEEKARIEALEAAERERFLNDVRAQLDEIITYTVRDLADLEAKERELQDIENLEDWQESDILVQIRKAKYHLSQERDRLTQAQEQQPGQSDPPGMASIKSNVEQAFRSIANASGTQQANAEINRALDLFSSPDVPVLVIISNDGDYDRPTTISRYLNYLKDQRKNPNRVHRVALDNQGRIREIELIKSQLRP